MMIGRIGKYEIKAELGQGAFTSVFRAFDPSVDRVVALKLAAGKPDAKLFARFRQQAAGIAKLDHPNIITIYELGEHQEAPFVAMQYLEGETLREIIAGRRSLTLLQKMIAMSQVADALRCAHENGEVHLDITPGNVMVAGDSKVTVMDFQSGRPSPLYAAPEQIDGAPHPNALSDVFTYGVVYYELLTGKHPFAAGSEQEVALRIRNQEPADLQAAARDCPEALAPVVLRALEKHPELRYQSFGELQFDAEPILIDYKQEQAAGLLSELRQLLDENQLDAAQAVLRRISAIDPANPEARRMREQIRQQLQRRTTAGGGAHHQPAAAEDASAERRRRAALLTAEADRLYAQLRFADSHKKVREALEADPQNAQASGLLEAVSVMLDVEAQQSIPVATEISMDSRRGEVVQRPETSRVEILESAEVREPLAPAHEKPRAPEPAPAIEKIRKEAAVLLEARDFAGAIQVLEESTWLFPEEASLQALLDSAKAAHARHERGQAIAQVLEQCKELQRPSGFAEARALVDSSVAQYGADPALLELRERLQKEHARHERELAVARALQRGDELRRQASFVEALEVAESALGQYGAEPALLQLREQLKEEQARQEREQALAQVIERCEELRRQASFAEALALVDAAVVQYSAEPVLLQLRERLQKEQACQERERAVSQAIGRCEELQGKGSFAKALELVDATAGQYGADPSLVKLRERLQKEQARHERGQALARVMQRCEVLQREGGFAEALELVDSAAAQYGADPALLRLRERLQKERARQEREQALGRVTERCEELRRQSGFAGALELLDSADAQYGPDSVLLQLRERLQREAVRHEREQALARLMERCEELQRQAGFAEALELVDSAAAKFGAETALLELRERLQAQREKQLRAEAAGQVRKEAAWLLEQSRPDLAIQLLESSLAYSEDDAQLPALLESSRQSLPEWERQQFVQQILAQVGSLEQRRQWRAASGVLEEALKRYPECHELAEAAGRVQTCFRDAERRLKFERRLELIREKIAEQAWSQALSVIETCRTDFPGEAELQELREQAQAGERQECERQELIIQAQQSLAEEDLERTEEILGKALAVCSQDTRLQELQQRLDRDKLYRQDLRTAEALLSQCRWQEADSALLRLLNHKPGDGRAQALLETVRLARAAEDEKRSYRQGCEEALQMLRQRQFDQAIESLRKLLVRFPHDAVLERELELALRAREQELERSTVTAPQAPPDQVGQATNGARGDRLAETEKRGPQSERRPEAPPVAKIANRSWWRRLVVLSVVGSALLVAAVTFFSSAPRAGSVAPNPSAARVLAAESQAHKIDKPEFVGPLGHQEPGKPHDDASVPLTTPRQENAPARASQENRPSAKKKDTPAIAKADAEKFDPSVLLQARAPSSNSVVPADEPPPALPAVSQPVVVGQNVLPVGASAKPLAPPPPPRQDAPRPPERLRVGGNFEPPKLISAPPPQVPLLAKERRVFGTVKLEATISKEGVVTAVTVLGGHPFLVGAAKEAAAKWRYQPATLNGDRIEIKIPIEIVFQPGR